MVEMMSPLLVPAHRRRTGEGRVLETLKSVFMGISDNILSDCWGVPCDLDLRGSWSFRGVVEI